MIYRVPISKDMIRKETRTKSGMWKCDFTQQVTYEANVFREPYRTWMENNLQGKALACHKTRAFQRDAYYFASLTRRDDVMLFKMKFSQFLIEIPNRW